MQIISKSTLKVFWEKHPQAETPLSDWFEIAARQIWESPADLKRSFGANIDFLADNRVVFDIAGNKYRLIVRVLYRHKAVQIKFVGTHAEYDRINAETIGK